MNDMDTNINNYNLDEMVQLFKISHHLTNDDLSEMNKMSMKINNLDPSSIDPLIVTFFKKVCMTLKCVNKYRDYMKINDVNYICNKTDDNYIVKKVINYYDFETISDPTILINKIVDSEDETYIENNNILDLKATKPAHPIVYDTTNTNNINTFENKVVSGTINSIKRITKKINLHMDSSFREKYYITNPTNFIYTLPKPFKNVVSMKLVSFEFPNLAWYWISNCYKNNSFVISISSEEDITTSYTICIPDGNYFCSSLMDYLNTQFFYQSTTTTLLQYLQFFVNPFTNQTQIYITSTAPSGLQFSIYFTTTETDNIMETCGWIMGFRLAMYESITVSTEFPSNAVLTSESLINTGIERYMYFVLNDYQYNYNETNMICFDKSSIEQFTLAKIAYINNKVSLNDNYSDGLLKERQYNGPVNITKFEIKLIDKFGNIININNMDFSFSLEVEVLYERNAII
jgi:hypothetical protein